ncbi:hypothetical protein L6452_42027 [Arctium lappa]|uniref:Uncharacterized protein n=1 Tax=Arctium lappa TaxID=4217 RepID=A0ACB8XH22_ARCLA|nr:hypothetical protein L6452_42027 [Arctium lappa]
MQLLHTVLKTNWGFSGRGLDSSSPCLPKHVDYVNLLNIDYSSILELSPTSLLVIGSHPPGTRSVLTTSTKPHHLYIHSFISILSTHFNSSNSSYNYKPTQLITPVIMEAIMGLSSPYLKLVSCRDTKMANSLLRSPLHHCRNNHKNKDVDFKLSISVSSTHSRGFRPISLSSSDTQAEVKSKELHIEESLNGFTIEAEEDLETKAKTEAQTVRVRFQLQRKCSFGQNFLIVGDDPIFGLWDPSNAIPLTWSDGHVWTVDLDIPVGKCIKFKFIMQERNGKFTWQPGPDRILECWESEKIITLCEDWENPDSRRIIEADPTLNQVEESAATTEMQMVATEEGMPVEPSLGTTDTPKVKKSSKKDHTEEPKYAINMKEVLVSNEAVPVLVPGLSQLSTTETDHKPSADEGSKDEPESAMNGSTMIATGVDMAMDLKLPELDSNQQENQDSCDPNEHQETQHVAKERDNETTQPAQSLPIQRGDNFMQKIFGIFGFQ